jgi:hypothetical protein
MQTYLQAKASPVSCRGGWLARHPGIHGDSGAWVGVLKVKSGGSPGGGGWTSTRPWRRVPPANVCSKWQLLLQVSFFVRD